MTTWHPISTAPRDGTRVMLFWPDGTSEQGFYLDNSNTPTPWQGWRPESGRPWPKGQPTHWQPLPTPPTTGE